MKIQRSTPAKIALGSSGLGVPDAALVQRRAEEIAAIEGREIPDACDWEAARRELHGRGAEEEGDSARIWASEAEGMGVESGGEVGALEPEDEGGLGVELIREGMEEAEHERMLLGSHLSREAEEVEPMEE